MVADKYNNIILTDSEKDILVHNDLFYKITSLKDGQVGGNSSVFTCTDPNENVKYAVKFSKFSYSDLSKGNDRQKRRVKKGLDRFEHEIEALKIANIEKHSNVVEFYEEGIFKSKGQKIPYFIMEYCEINLSSFLKENSISINQKLLLTKEVLRGVKELHRLELYHRDIKPDNIFMVEGVWKIGDLGISVYQNDYSLDWENEKIGPYGWLSPEVMNKVLCAGTPLESNFQCIVNNLSDIFQLGKLVWFIFLGNIPIGQVRRNDFTKKPEKECDIIFDLIFNLLQYEPKQRWDLKKAESEILKALEIADSL